MSLQSLQNTHTNRPIPLYQPKIPWSNDSRTEITVWALYANDFGRLSSRKRCSE